MQRRNEKSRTKLLGGRAWNCPEGATAAVSAAKVEAEL